MVKKVIDPPAQAVIPTEPIIRARRNVPLRPDLADCRTEEDFHAYAGLPNEGLHPSQFRTDLISAAEYNEVWDTNGVIPGKTSIDKVRPEHEEALIELLSKIYPDGLKNREVRKTVSYLFAFNNCLRAKQDPQKFKVNWAAVAAKSRAYSSKVKSEPASSAPASRAEASKSQQTTAPESIAERPVSGGTGIKLEGRPSIRSFALCPTAYTAYGENISRLEVLCKDLQETLDTQQADLVSKKELVVQSQAKGAFFLASQEKLQKIKDNISRLQAVTGPDAGASAELLSLEREKDMAEYMLKALVEMGGGPIDEGIVQQVATIAAEVANNEVQLAKAKQHLQNLNRLRELTRRAGQLVSIYPVTFRLPIGDEERCSTCGLAFQDDYTLSLKLKCGHVYHVSCLSLLMEKTHCLECSETVPAGLVEELGRTVKQEPLYAGAADKQIVETIDLDEVVATTPDSNRKRKHVKTPLSKRTPGHKSTRTRTPQARTAKKGTRLFPEVGTLEAPVDSEQHEASSQQHIAAPESTVLKTPTQSKADSSSSEDAEKYKIVPNSAATSTKASSNTVDAGADKDVEDPNIVDKQVNKVVARITRLTRSRTKKAIEPESEGPILFAQDLPKRSVKRRRRQPQVVLTESEAEDSERTETDNEETKVQKQPITYKRRPRTVVSVNRVDKPPSPLSHHLVRVTDSQETPIHWGQGDTRKDVSSYGYQHSPSPGSKDKPESSRSQQLPARPDSTSQQSPAQTSTMQQPSTVVANVVGWTPRRKCMVLDINGVLAQTQQRRMNQKILHPPQTNHVVKETASKYLICRPGYHEFVEWALQRFDVVIWSASLLRNTRDMVDALFPDLQTRFLKIYGQEHCYACEHPTSTEKQLFFKELKVVLEDFPQYHGMIFLVDDSLHKGFLNPAHTTVPVMPFKGQEEDNFLQKFVCPALEYLSSHTVRETISQIDFTDAWLAPETVAVLDYCLNNYLVSAYYILNAPIEVQRQLLGTLPGDEHRFEDFDDS